MFDAVPEQFKFKDNYGLEFELEGIDKPYKLTPDWRSEEDGSLRYYGREFVSNGATPYEFIGEHLNNLQKTMTDAGIKPIESNLASTHIHIDVRDLNLHQFRNFLAILMMMEVCIAKSSGEDRYNNYFCLGSGEADLYLSSLQEALWGGSRRFVTYVSHKRVHHIRYCGFNLASLSTYGSLEVRYLGTCRDPRVAKGWVDFYQNVKTFVKTNSLIDIKEWLNKALEGDELQLKVWKILFKPPFKIGLDDLKVGAANAYMIAVPPMGNIHIPEELAGNGTNKFFGKGE